MEGSAATPTNPLGLHLDFLFGRGYLWAKHERLSDWITLEHLRMEIPDLTFPFDARGGLHRFRNTRCLVREIEMSTSEVGLGDLLRQASEGIDGFDDLEVHFLDGAVHVSARVRSLGADTFLSFRAALIPPEPARADEVHLSLYDYRAYGPLPFPARLLAFELMTRLLNTPILRPPGRGQSFTVGIAGDILQFRPLKLILLHIFPKVGWKLPNLSDVVLEGAQIRPGLLTLRAVSHDAAWNRGPEGKPAFQLGATVEGARALAAYEAKDLFAHADQALFDRQIRQAMELFAGYRDVYGLHPELVARSLDCLLADPSPANLAEAESLCRELEREDPKDLRALHARPTLALHAGRRADARAAFERLAEALRERGDTYDWALCQLAIAQFVRNSDPADAARRLREVLKVAPRNRVALERLRTLYEEMGEAAGIEDVLKRLTGVYTDRDSLTETYLALARHLIDRQGELGEARIFLERVLRLDPTRLEALDTLGESYVMGGQPLRALKAFGSAARAAESQGHDERAASLHFRIARLWADEVGDPNQALLACRRALDLDARAAQGAEQPRLPRAEMLRFAANLSERQERFDDAISYHLDAVALLEALREAPHRRDEQLAPPEVIDAALVDSQRRLAEIYAGRGREEVAASHWRRLLALRPDEPEVIEALAQHYRGRGKPEQLIEFYDELLRRNPPAPRAATLHAELGEVYAAMGLAEEAREHLMDALHLAPSAPAPRRQLFDLLARAGRFETLRDALNGLLLRVQEREARFEILMELGLLQLEQLDEPASAVRSYLEAMQLKPTEAEAILRLREALEQVVSARGARAPAPVGEGDVGYLLERVLHRVAEIAETSTSRARALRRLAELAEQRGDEAVAAEARRRADAEEGEAGDDSAGDVEARLDALLEADAPSTPASIPPPPEPVTRDEDDEDDEDDEEALAAFRARFEQDVKRPQPVPKVGEVDPDSSLGSSLGRLKRDRQPESEPESEAEKAFSERPTAKFRITLPPLDDEPRQTEQAEPAADPAAELDAARRADDPRRLVDAGRALLEAVDAGRAELDAEARLDLEAELGEVLYYDLEDAQGALPYLERVRRRDPEGRGGRHGLLNALEAIYEEEGQVEGRLKILRERLERAESDEMDTVYRLLLAQLVWDSQRDREAAERWLQKVLERDSRHEAAHRLMADIATEVEDWRSAARHYEVVLSVSAGGLDAVEVERTLAELCLDHLHEPERAAKHFEAVLEAAPGDSQALMGLKSCKAAIGDWPAYIETLGQELGLLVGQPGGLDLGAILALDPDAVAPALRVPASQIVADVAEVVEAEMGRDADARQLWGKVHELWHEHVEALERRIDLDRKLEEHGDLAADLEAWADMLLDPTARFEALVECAQLHAQLLDDPEAARPIYTEALAIVEGEPHPPEGVDAARRALKALEDQA